MRKVSAILLSMFAFSFSFSGVADSSLNDELKKMDQAEKQFQKRLSRLSCAFMDLETMFPNEDSRALAKAAGKGKIVTVEKLIGSGIDVNTRGTGNCSVLFWSMRNEQGFKKLLELGANPNIVFDDGGSVMHFSVRHEDSQFLRATLKYGGNPNLVAGQMGKTPLFEAVGPSNKNKLNILLNAGANINFQMINGNTPMMVAAGLGQFDVVLKLLNQGADYTLKNNNGRNLMDIIEWRSKTMDPNNELTHWMHKVVKWLNKKGIPVNSQTSLSPNNKPKFVRYAHWDASQRGCSAPLG